MSEELPVEAQNRIVVFGAKQIRRLWVDDQWYFSVVDIVSALTDSASPRKYWDAMKRREEEATGVQLSTFCRQLKLTSADGKSYTTDCVNTESAFRIIQSIPSPKAEPFKRWLAQVGYQRVQEIGGNWSTSPANASSRARITWWTSPSPPCRARRKRNDRRSPGWAHLLIGRSRIVDSAFRFCAETPGRRGNTEGDRTAEMNADGRRFRLIACRLSFLSPFPLLSFVPRVDAPDRDGTIEIAGA